MNTPKATITKTISMDADDFDTARKFIFIDGHNTLSSWVRAMIEFREKIDEKERFADKTLDEILQHLKEDER